MIKAKQNQSGLSLLEIILVISVAALIFIVSIRQFNVFRVEGNAQQVQFNVDTIMQAMERYYKANCYGSTDYSTDPPVITPGTLNLAHVPAPTVNYPISIPTDLRDAGYLEIEKLPSNPLVDGYYAQFNMYQQPRMACTNGTNAVGSTTEQGCTESKQIGTSIIWRAQVAVHIIDTDNKETYLRMFNADCLSSLQGNIVLPCSEGKDGDYAVWERLPSYASPTGQSSTWIMNPLVTQFTQMYTTNPVTNLTSGNHDPEYQYFYCGS